MSLQSDGLAIDVVGDAVEAARTGDRAALSTIYREYAELVFRYVLACVGDRATAEDVTATVFVRVMEGIGRYEPSGAPFGAWLFRIAHNA
ncbi:MAG: hypothetical protein FJ029_06135, partial [Actinobacteria bacterium]|nr:hypothetical protein [Actinomycetota bacterium]